MNRLPSEHYKARSENGPIKETKDQVKTVACGKLQLE